MSKINLKNFVDINIKSHVTTGINSTRDTIVIFTADGTADTQHTVSSLAEAAGLYENTTDIFKYLSIYFNHGGVKALVIEGVDYSDLTAEMIASLDNNYIIVTYAAPALNIEAVYAKLKSIASTRALDDEIYGVNEKLIIAGSATMTDSDSIKNFVVKYSTVLGAEMTIAAYLSQINVYGFNTVYDYAFTTESLNLEENITDSQFTTLMTNNYNVDIMLAKEVRNCGGNCKNGADLVNSYVKIIMHQTLTDALVSLLTQKLKSTNGISKIYATISQELENYLNCGYLTTDKVWNDETLTVTRGENTYTIIEKGTPLINGYNITVLPMSSLNSTEIAQHSAPPVYVIIADQYGIRKITINGEVI